MRKLLSPFIVVAFLATLPAWAEAPAAAPAPYLTPEQVDLMTLLPPPPQAGSKAQESDLAMVLDAQRHRTQHDKDGAIAEGNASVFHMADVLGPNFTPEKLPKFAAFIQRVMKTTSPLYRGVKDHYERPRPFVGSAKVHAIPSLQQGEYEKDKHAYTFSYPSGHATFGAVYAILLSQMVPEKREALFERGWEYGQHRVVAGMHYPFDVQSGRIDGTVIAYALMKNSEFQKDFAAAKAELRSGLGLAP